MASQGHDVPSLAIDASYTVQVPTGGSPSINMTVFGG